MATESLDTLKDRLHELIEELVLQLAPENLTWLDHDDSSVDLEGVEIDENGTVSLGLSYHGWLWVDLNELLSLAFLTKSTEAAEARTILEKLQNQPAPRKKAKKAPSRS